jgi:two-component system, NarL family, nitrate/nitrite response regulator NarL
MEETACKICTLIVDDHSVFRESLAKALAAEPDLEVCDCGSISDALQILAQRRIDIVLLDHDLGTERAWQFLPAAGQQGFTGRVLIVTAWVSDTEARRLLRQGAAGIFRKESPLSVLTESIHIVAGGGTWIDRRYAGLFDRVNVAKPSQGAKIKLNDRERRVLRFVLEGLSNKEIAFKLTFSESYVKAILQRLFEKVGVETRGQLVRVVLEQYQDQLND